MEQDGSGACFLGRFMGSPNWNHVADSVILNVTYFSKPRKMAFALRLVQSFCGCSLKVGSRIVAGLEVISSTICLVLHGTVTCAYFEIEIVGQSPIRQSSRISHLIEWVTCIGNQCHRDCNKCSAHLCLYHPGMK